MTAMRPFADRLKGALEDPNIAPALLQFQRSWRITRDSRIAELEVDQQQSFDELRHRLAESKDRALSAQPAYIDEFRRHAEAAGAVVVTCATAADANRYISDLCHRVDTRLVVKGKSMVSEEIGLNDALEAEGITAVETDLGEWLLQLAGDHPSHLVMPAIHKRRQQCAKILEAATGRPFDPEDIETMVHAARIELREPFLQAGVGVCGANALIAESGSVMVITNEGNGCLTTSLPPVTVVVAGAEKLVPTFADAMLQLRLLARSATGQTMTTYTTFMTGPSRDPARASLRLPQRELHIVFVDNGRSEMAADPHLVDALRCIRCGACANVCPPYQVVGGHAFGHVYTGAIGLIDTAFHHGWDNAAGPQSLCVSCGACATVCPVEIPLPRQILEIRNRAFDAGLDGKATTDGAAARAAANPGSRLDHATSRRNRVTKLALRAFSSRSFIAFASRIASVATAPLTKGGSLRVPLPRKHAWRRLPAIPFVPARSHPALRDINDEEPIAETELAGQTVSLLLQCVCDRLAPEIPISAARLLRAGGAEIDVPRKQHCCGLPAFDAGDWEQARKMARQTIDVFKDADLVVTPAPSCAAMIRHDYKRLFEDAPHEQARAQKLAGRTFDLVSILQGPGRLPPGCLDGGTSGESRGVTVHRFCQSTTALELDDAQERLITDLTGRSPIPLDECATCCGFGGSTSFSAPEVSRGILDRKLDNVARTNAAVLVTDNPGCALHLEGGRVARGLETSTEHIAVFLARGLPQAERSPAIGKRNGAGR